MLVLLLIGIVGYYFIEWYQKTFNVSYREILFTIKAPLAGADSHFLRDAFYQCIPGLIIVAALMLLLHVLFKYFLTGKSSSGNHLTISYLILGLFTFFSVAGALNTMGIVDNVLGISETLESEMQISHIYEDYYVKPNVSAINTDSNRNLLYIILESMETTYASSEAGGRQPYNNYMPNLTALAVENISFSNSERLGGFHSSTGSTWTMGSLFSTMSGIPFEFPIDGNDMNTRGSFASGTTTLGDILHSKGYYQEFLCGSDADFAGRDMFFSQHGYDNIYDLFSAINDGYLSENDTVWWGLEDRMLYDIAKDELSRISQSDQPFNLTMLTVDTHHVDGWVCDLCEDTYDEQLANVVTCADNQIHEFITWCKEQPWYDNTTIIIQGDHPRMDNSLVDGVSFYDRTIYNCFINTGIDASELKTRCREFTPFDMFPSILFSIGFKIPDDRLGLGTNMFSEKNTLVEELGYEYMEEELQKNSNYYWRFY